jgi:hypothetical protein
MADGKRVVNLWSGWVPVAMSAAAISVLILALTTGWGKGPHGDEGAAAHLWQLFVGLQVPLIAVFLATSNWRRPLGVMSLLGLQVLGLVLAMAPVAMLHL